MAIETTAAGGALIKLFGVPVLAGAAATSLGFMFMWPQSTREAFIRFFSSIIISTFIGPALVAAGLPAWWVLGACVRWFDRRRGKDIGELAADAAAVVKDVRGGL